MMKFATQIIFWGLCCILIAEPGRATDIPYRIEKQSINVVIDPALSSVHITTDITFSAVTPVQKIAFLINKAAQVSRIEFKGKKVPYQMNQDWNLLKFFQRVDTALQKEYQLAAEIEVILPKSQDKGQIRLIYDLTAGDSVDQAAFSREYIAYQVKGYVGSKGIFISPSYFWYPTLPDNLSRFVISATTPDSFMVVTQGELIKNTVDQNKRSVVWEIAYPASSVHLVGARYNIGEARYRDISIYTFFFPQSQELQESYLNACQRYLGMYEKMIGPYPFTKFAVVENFFPTGYGMPSYTLLGSQVIRLPFIIYTSLGHEVAHNWWGNSVYIDYDSGNWCEGLTTYFADHYYKELKDESEAAQYRRDINRDFTVYVKENKDFPLNKFVERTESSSRAIGYGKSAMVFHQLRRIIGDSLYFNSFQVFYREYRFKDASWSDISHTVNSVTGTDLDWFFDQWLNRKGAPEIFLKSVDFDDPGLSITLEQSAEELYRLYIPIQIIDNDSNVTREKVWLTKSKETFQFNLAGKPLQVRIDPGYDVFRKLSKAEIPPTLAEIYAREEALVVMPDNCPPGKIAAYEQFANTLIDGEENYRVVKSGELNESDLTSYSLYLLGTPSENSLISRLPLLPPTEIEIKDKQLKIAGAAAPRPDDVTIFVTRTSRDDQNICVISLGDNQKTGRIAQLLSHYGKYSYLIFTDGKNSTKEIFSVTDSPMIYNLK